MIPLFQRCFQNELWTSRTDICSKDRGHRGWIFDSSTTSAPDVERIAFDLLNEVCVLSWCFVLENFTCVFLFVD